MSNTEQSVYTVIQSALGNKDLQLNLLLSASEIEGWNSLTHVKVLVAIEKKFNINFTTSEVIGLQHKNKKIADLIQLINSKVHDGSSK